MKLRIAYITIPLVLLGIFLLYTSVSNNNNSEWITTTVERADVQDSISVSGFVEAKNTADLSFPVVGIVTDVFVEEGVEVLKGDLLATLGAKKLVAQRADAVAVLQKVLAARDELTNGPTATARVVTNTTVTNAQANLQYTIATEAKKVSNAYIALLSTGLEARTTDSTEEATAPIVSGSYTCNKEGTYTIDPYRSATQSGYSYIYSGLESGTSEASVEQPIALGTCGLLLKFTQGDSYTNSQWTIEIPNTKSSSYVTYKNAYDLAIQQESSIVQAAKDTLTLTTDNATFANADPTTTAVQQADASIQSAQAKIAQIDAQITDLSIVAPFDGIITTVDVQSGETAGTAPVITILAQDAFTLKARIPEIDIRKITSGQPATIVFDASTKETLNGTLLFVSPLATEIDGVAYFETTIVLDQTPPWMRSGLNADIEIIINTIKNTLRVPKRYIQTDVNGNTYVLKEDTKNGTKINVTVAYTGNDGFASVTGIDEGDMIIAPVLQ